MEKCKNIKEKSINKKKKHEFTLITVIMFVILALYALTLFYFLFWAIITCFKEQSDFRLNVLGFPKKWVSHFGVIYTNLEIKLTTIEGIKYVYMLEMVTNSFVYAISMAFLSTAVPCVAGYVTARFPFKMSRWYHTFCIVAMTIPIIGAGPAQLQLIKRLGLYDNILGLCLWNASPIGMTYLLFYGTFKGLSGDYADAAKIDGAGNLTIFLRIMLPMVVNTMATLALMAFVSIWNDYGTPLIYLPTHPTFAVGVQQLSLSTERYLSRTPVRLAGAVMLLLPNVIIFSIFSNRFLS